MKNIKNKTEIVKAAQTLGADSVADLFWESVQANLETLSREIKPNQVKPRQTRKN